MELIKVNTEDLAIIESLARKIWPIAYQDILSKEQLNYMLKMFYSEKALKEQLRKKHQFYLLKKNEEFLGFVSFEINCMPNKTKIHKIYILPNQQGKGLGRILFEKVKEEAIKQEQQAIFLNVNKYNKAKVFYINLGFKVTGEEVIPIGNGFVMDDYVMETPIVK